MPLKTELEDDYFDFNSLRTTKPSWNLFDNVIIPILAITSLIVGWPYFVYLFIQSRKSNTHYEEKVFCLKREDLHKAMSIEEIERREIVHDPLGAVPNLPFGHLHQAWLTFKDKMHPDDKIWSFSTQWTSEWGDKQQMEGYAIVKTDEPCDHFLTLNRSIEDE